MKKLLYTAACALILNVTGWAQESETAPAKEVEAPPAQATTTEDSDEWKVQLGIPVWLPSTNINLSFGDRTANTVVSPDQLKGKIDFALSGHIEATNGEWGVMGDGFYVNLSDDLNFRRVGGSVRFNETLLQTNAFYRVNKGEVPVDVFVGLRLYDFGFNTSFNRDGLIFKQAYQRSISRSWVDPVLGVRAAFPLGEDLTFGVYGDVGGFGVGSDFSYRVSGALDYNVSDTTSLGLGYAAIGAKYAKGSGLDQLKIDLSQYGPMFTVKFKL